MQRIVLSLIAIMTMITTNGQTLTERQKDSWFQHLTYHKDVQEGASNEWCEPVDDATYDTLN